MVCTFKGMVTETYAGKKCKKGNHRLDKRGKCKRCKKIVIKIINKGPTGGGQIGDCNVCEELAKIQEALAGGGGNGGTGSPCVDGGTEVEGRWIVSNNDLYVCDITTGLTWQKSPSLATVSHTDAQGLCNTLSPPMRLPTRLEFLSIIDSSQTGPPLPLNHPFTNLYTGTGAGADNSYQTTTVQSAGHIYVLNLSSNAPPFPSNTGWNVLNIAGNPDDPMHYWCVRDAQ